MLIDEIEKFPTRLIRWHWAVDHGDGRFSAGWCATKRGARKEIARARADDYPNTGPHKGLAVGWLQKA